MLLVFDLGATKVRAALVRDRRLGKVVAVETEHSAAGFAAFLGILEELAAGEVIKAVVGGLPAQLEGEEGRVVLARNLPGWLGLEVKSRIGQLFDCPVYITNDVKLGGLGESHYGAGIKKWIMAYFTVSTGVNAVRIVDGRVDATIGRYEIGEQLLPGSGGRPESLERLVGGAALRKRMGRLPAAIEDKALWLEIGRDLARGLFNTALHWDTELMVLGGSMMNDIDLDEVGRELAKLAHEWPVVPKLKRAELGEKVGLMGALAWHEQLVVESE